MKVVIMISAGTWGGAETHTLGLAKALGRCGYQVTLLCLTDKTYDLFAKFCDEIEVKNMKIRNINRTNVVKLMRSFSPWRGAACLYSKGTLHAGCLALEVAARLSFGKLITIEHLEPMPLPLRTSRRYLGGVLPGIGLWWYRMRLQGYSRSLIPNTIVAVSEAVRKSLINNYSFNQTKTIVVHNGVEVNRFYPDDGCRKVVRTRWGIDNNTLLFGAVGRLSSIKGFDLAVEALRLFAERHPEGKVALLLVGDGPERANLERQVAIANLQGKVTFAGFATDISKYYNAFDVIVIPSRSEALPLVLIEAMASGCLPSQRVLVARGGHLVV